jgi:hypothetical protein
LAILKGEEMMKVIAALLAEFLIFAGPAHAGGSHIADGLFCTKQSDIEATYNLLSEGVSLAGAIALVNRDQVSCAFADRIGYMLVRPSIVDGFGHGGAWLRIYEASLIGVLVGGNPRPVEPPLVIYFVPNKMLPSSILLGQT